MNYEAFFWIDLVGLSNDELLVKIKLQKQFRVTNISKNQNGLIEIPIVPYNDSRVTSSDIKIERYAEFETFSKRIPLDIIDGFIEFLIDHKYHHEEHKHYMEGEEGITENVIDLAMHKATHGVLDPRKGR